ncbi:hypothetical protein ACQJBY_059350 [Aegilops geniculata]
MAPSHIDLTPTGHPFLAPTRHHHRPRHPPPPPSSCACQATDPVGLPHSLLLCLPGEESGRILLHLRPPVPARWLDPPTPPFSRASRSRIQQDPPPLSSHAFLETDTAGSSCSPFFYGGVELSAPPSTAGLPHPTHRPPWTSLTTTPDEQRCSPAPRGMQCGAPCLPLAVWFAPPTPTSLATACPRLIPLRPVLSVMGSTVLFYHFAAHLLAERRTAVMGSTVLFYHFVAHLLAERRAAAATTSVGAAGEFAVALLPLDITVL